MAEVLAALRGFDYEHIYLRPASQAQAGAVIDVLRALVEHFADRPHLLLDDDVEYPPRTGSAPAMAGDAAAVQRAVAYVGGMTDRFAFRSALALLDWDPAKLPRGIDTSR
jgi:dGTPase